MPDIPFSSSRVNVISIGPWSIFSRPIARSIIAATPALLSDPRVRALSVSMYLPSSDSLIFTGLESPTTSMWADKRIGDPVPGMRAIMFLYASYSAEILFSLKIASIFSESAVSSRLGEGISHNCTNKSINLYFFRNSSSFILYSIIYLVINGRVENVRIHI